MRLFFMNLFPVQQTLIKLLKEQTSPINHTGYQERNGYYRKGYNNGTQTRTHITTTRLFKYIENFTTKN